MPTRPPKAAVEPKKRPKAPKVPTHGATTAKAPAKPAAKASKLARTAPARPVHRSDAILEVIFERLANGESMRQICREPGMPDRGTVIKWLDADPDLATRCARAREHQGDACDEEIAEVIADVREGRLLPDAGRVVISGLQWRAAKLAPKRFGEAMQVKHSGSVGLVALEMDADQAKRVAQSLLAGMEDGDGPEVAAP